MKKCKNVAVIALTILAALTALYVIVPGVTKQGNAYIADYSVSEDGTEMTITVGVSTSVGYIRKVSEHQQQGGKLYLDCYSAFGGLNGSIGAKSKYVVSLDMNTEMIALYRAPDCYEPVLEKNENNEWQRVNAQ